MRYFSYLSSLATILAASVATVSTRSTLPHPRFTALFTGEVKVTYNLQAKGPFGERCHYEAHGGDLLNPSTGEIVASIHSLSDDGLTTDGGLFFTSSIMPLIWSADGHFASVSLNGVANHSSITSWSYVHVETDSPTYSWLNGKFLILQGDGSAFPVVRFTIYEETG